MEEKKKLIHIEFLRIIAAFFVIFNHTGSKGYFLFSTHPAGTFPYFLYMAFSVFIKISVPLFLMISGALLLKKDITYEKIFKNKILKMLIVLVIFSAVFYIRLHIKKYSTVFNIKDFLIRLYKGDIIIPYWYLYAYISFLLAFPFLRSMVKELPEGTYKYLILLSVIFTSVLPCLEYRFSLGTVTLNQYGKISWIFTNIVIFPLIGYYLENVLDIEKVSKKQLLILNGISVLGIIVSCYMTYFKHKITGECNEVVSQDFMDTFVLLIAIPVYLNAKIFFQKHSIKNWLEKIILSIGSCSFGIYLIHMAIIESTFISNIWNACTVVNHFNCMIVILLLCLLSFLISYIIVFILKKIPGVKKLI